MKSIFMGNDLPPFAFDGLDRLELERDDPHALAARLAQGKARFIPIWRGRILMNDKRDQMQTLDTIPHGIETLPILLGDARDASYFSIDVSVLPSQDQDDNHEQNDKGKTGPLLVEKGVFCLPREASATTPAFDMGMTALALHFNSWDKRSQFCGRCGHKTLPRQGGVSRQCGNSDCGDLYFPRINPAVIMLIRDQADERIVMGQAPHLPTGMTTILAGYLSPGETLIQAVKRETMEEVGIEVDDVQYYGSQPWAYSGSLMVGFSAVATSTALKVNHAELSHADWYSRDQIRTMKAQGMLTLPSGSSIARMLIDAWLDPSAR